MSLLSLLEKLINEHGSATILGQRLAAIKDDFAKSEKERTDLQQKFSDAEKEIVSLRQQIEEYKRREGFVEYRGALFKRKVTGGYDPTVRCPVCTHAMSSMQGVLPYSCAKDKQKVDFTGANLPEVLKGLTEENL